ncbi:Lar family restriction alleviation protein [Serratia marcescens]|uniref:Lar family restriction alleviation protein n=1 Tax=Serratia marcescens TaxID=615 RepID=UPI003B5AB63D
MKERPVIPELKRCPFCGGDNPELFEDSYEISFIKCACGARGAKADDLNGAAEAWNYRSEGCEVAS